MTASTSSNNSNTTTPPSPPPPPKSPPFLCQCTIHEDSNPPDLTSSSISGSSGNGDANMVLLDAREWYKSKVMISGLIAGMLLQGSFLIVLPQSTIFSILLTRFLNYLFGILALVSLLWNMAKIGRSHSTTTTNTTTNNSTMSIDNCKLVGLILTMATLSGALLQCVLFSSFLDIPEHVRKHSTTATEMEKQVAHAMMWVQKAVEVACGGMVLCAFFLMALNATTRRFGDHHKHKHGLFATVNRLTPLLRHGIVFCASTSVGSLFVVLVYYMVMDYGVTVEDVDVDGAVEPTTTTTIDDTTNTPTTTNGSISIVELSAFVSLVLCYGVLVLTVWIQEVISNQEAAAAAAACDEKKEGAERDDYEMIEYVFVC